LREDHRPRAAREVDEAAKDFTPLHRLKNLKLVGLAGEKAEANKIKPAIEPDQLAGLKKALPDAAIVTIIPMCLGSGWILALAAAVAAGWLVVRRRTRESGARCAG